MPNFLSDPLAASFIPAIVLLVFSWTMYSQLENNPSSRASWLRMLQKAHLLPKETPENAGMVDYAETIESSRNLFKWLGILSIVLTLWLAFSYYRRLDPYFLWGPKPVTVTNPGEKPPLPPRQPGAGGGGFTGNAPAVGAPGAAGQQPEGSPGAGGGAPAPGPGAAPGPAAPPAPGMTPPATGGGGYTPAPPPPAPGQGGGGYTPAPPPAAPGQGGGGYTPGPPPAAPGQGGGGYTPMPR